MFCMDVTLLHPLRVSLTSINFDETGIEVLKWVCHDPAQGHVCTVLHSFSL
ncbi:hypothetical protein TSMEX_004483 [Taenia solium]|eukprot:TsM_000733300 transcript=TsM_000733300 gene=TsM_000733300